MLWGCATDVDPTIPNTQTPSNTPTQSSTPTPTLTFTATRISTPSPTGTPYTPIITGFVLVNPVTGNDVLTLVDGLVVDLDAYNLTAYNIRVVTVPAVVFYVDVQVNASMLRRESGAPYSMWGDNNGVYTAQTELGFFQLYARANSVVHRTIHVLFTRSPVSMNYPQYPVDRMLPYSTNFCGVNWLIRTGRC